MVFSQLKHGGKFESSGYCSLVESLTETGTKNNKQQGNINMKRKKIRKNKIAPAPKKDRKWHMKGRARISFPEYYKSKRRCSTKLKADKFTINEKGYFFLPLPKEYTADGCRIAKLKA